MDRARLLKFILFISLLLGIAALIYLTPLRKEISVDKIAHFFKEFRKHPLAIPLFITATAIGFWAVMPAFIFSISAGIIFGPFLGFVVALTGLSIGAMLAFVSGRTFLHNFVIEHMHRVSLLRKMNAKATRNGFFVVLLSRLLMVVPWNVFNYLLSLTSVRMKDYAWGTVLGMAPEIAVMTIFGSSIEDALKRPHVIIIPAVLIFLLAFVVHMVQKKYFAEK